MLVRHRSRSETDLNDTSPALKCLEGFWETKADVTGSESRKRLKERENLMNSL
jgi:hypothetical protein